MHAFQELHRNISNPYLICSPKDRMLYCHFINEMNRLKVRKCIETKYTMIFCLHSLSSLPSSRVSEVRSCIEYILAWYKTYDKGACRHGYDYEPIITLPDDLVSNLAASIYLLKDMECMLFFSLWFS